MKFINDFNIGGEGQKKKKDHTSEREAFTRKFELSSRMSTSSLWEGRKGVLIKALCFYCEKFGHYPSRDYGE